MTSDNLASHPFAAIADAVPAFGAALRRHDAGDLNGARLAYLDLVDQPGLTALCLHQLALIASARGEYGRATDLLRRSIRLDPTQALSYHNLRAALERSGDAAGAVAALVDLGCIHYNQKDFIQAAGVFEEVIRRDPINYAAQINLGTAMAWLHDNRRAARHLLLGIELFGRLVKDVGVFAKMMQGRLADWTGVAPDHQMLPAGIPHGALEKVEDALTTLGKLLDESNRSVEAMLCLRKSVEMAPGFALGHWNLSLSMLGEGDFAQGWKEYEWRWHWDKFPEPRRLLPVPLWRGEPLEGKRVLVWAEQGFGDCLQFVPLVEGLIAQGASILLEAAEPLVRLLSQSFPHCDVIARSANPHSLAADRPVDYVVSLLSLPERLGLIEADLPLDRGYLRAHPDDQALWAARLESSPRPRVGLVWAGRPAHADDAKRSIPLPLLAPLFAETRVSWYSLQVGPAAGELSIAPQIMDLQPDLKDFADTAAAISQLDLVIAVDTAVAHLAGGLGAQVWMLTRDPAEWRWRRSGATTPWYPSMRIFRQTETARWDEPIQAVASALGAWLDQGGGEQGAGGPVSLRGGAAQP